MSLADLSYMTLPGEDCHGNRHRVSFDNMYRRRGCCTQQYKGRLNGPGPDAGKYCYVRALKDFPGRRGDWKPRIDTANKAAELSHMFNKEMQKTLLPLDKPLNNGEVVKVSPKSVGEYKRIIFNRPFTVLMDEITSFPILSLIMSKCFASGGKAGLGRTLSDDEYVLVEYYIDGDFSGLYLNNANAWRGGTAASGTYSHWELAAFSHFTWCVTSGQLTVADFTGAICKDDKNRLHYRLTTPEIHSTQQLYGSSDQGASGITQFFKRHVCNDICSGWSKPYHLMYPGEDKTSYKDTFNNIFTKIV